MKVGLDQYSLYHLPSVTGVAVLDLARSLGLDGVQFVDIHKLSPTLDRAELAEVRAHAVQQRMYLEVGVSCVNPRTPDQYLLRDGDGDLVCGLKRQLELIADASIGSRTVRCFIAGPGDRLRGSVSWAEQVADAVAVLKQVTPTLYDLDLKLAIENHADLATYELIEIVEALGTDVAGICFDTGNVKVTIEEPLAATRRAAPFSVATHLKDGILVFGEDGLVLSPRSVGQGILPVAEILQVLHAENPELALSIEDYGMLLPVPIFNRDYVESFAEVAPTEMAALVQSAWRCQQSVAEGVLASPAAVERTPWSVQATSRLKESARFVHAVVDELSFSEERHV